MVRRRARRLGVAGLAAMAVGLAACDCDTGFPELFLDDFERACGEAACDWAIEAGGARRVTTFHAAEHGLELEPGAQLALALAPLTLTSEGPGQPADQLQVLIDCAPGTGLRVEAEVDVDEGATVVFEARVEAGAARSDDGRLVLARVPLEASGVDEVIVGEARLLRLIVEGQGACVIDDLRLIGGRRFSCNG